MGVGEWVALATFGVVILGFLVNVVWLLSQIKTKLDNVVEVQSESRLALKHTSGQIQSHLIECAADKTRTGSKLSEHERRITVLETHSPDTHKRREDRAS